MKYIILVLLALSSSAFAGPINDEILASLRVEVKRDCGTDQVPTWRAMGQRMRVDTLKIANLDERNDCGIQLRDQMMLIASVYDLKDLQSVVAKYKAEAKDGFTQIRFQ